MKASKKSSGSRTVLIVLGAIGLFVLCCCGGIGGVAALGFRRGARDDREAKAYAYRAILAMGRDWRVETARPFLSPTWSDVVSPSGEAELFGALAKKLGPIQSLGAFTSSHFAYGTTEGRRAGTRITMSAPAIFQKTTGTIHVELAKIERKWGIESLRIDSPALLK